MNSYFPTVLFAFDPKESENPARPTSKPDNCNDQGEPKRPGRPLRPAPTPGARNQDTDDHPRSSTSFEKSAFLYSTLNFTSLPVEFLEASY